MDDDSKGFSIDIRSGLCFQSPHKQLMLPQNQDPAMHSQNVFSKFLKVLKMTHNKATKGQNDM